MVFKLSRILLCCIALSSCVSSEPEIEFIDDARAQDVLAIMPYEFDDQGRITVAVFVNGQGPLDFIIDSAATRTLVYESTRQALELEFIEDETTFVHGAVLAEDRQVFPIANLSVGSIEQTNIRSFSLPDPQTPSPHPAGILGLDFLSQYSMYVNVDDQRLIFAKSGYTPDRQRFVSIPIEFDDLGLVEFGLPIIEVRVQGRPVDALLDLGASETIANWAAANKFGVNVRNYLRGQIEFDGVFGTIPIQSAANGAQIKIGKRIWSNQHVSIANLPVFKTLKRSETPAMLVSAALLREENYIIDFPASKLFLEADREQRKGTGITELCTLLPSGLVICRDISTNIPQ